MSFLSQVLEPPSYGFERNGTLYVPTHREIFKEFFFRINPLKDRRHWLALLGWTAILVSVVPFYLFWTKYFTWSLFLIGFVYSMVVLGTHGTIYYHRYGTHRAYQFKNSIWLFLVKNSVIKLIPEEIYIVSHYVHHQFSEKPGDPYNVNGGWLYCFLADAITQPIRKNLTEAEYFKVKAMVSHTGIYMNTYEQYQYWGSVCHPFYTILNFALNWAFWFGVCYLIGGIPLAVTIFAASGVWAVGVRTFNFDGHGGGKDKRKVGIDFYWEDHSINQLWPGLITGEWHNNHHLYPQGARAGFLPYQLDYAWYAILLMYKLGGVTSYRDFKKDFYEKYHPTNPTLAYTLA